MTTAILAAPLAAAATDLPPAGRSLFDELTRVQAGADETQRVPYPFEALLRMLESRAGTDALGRPGLAAVLIPLGRSLQRNASSERPFDHPRVVAAVTGEVRESAGAPLLKDRLFLGFQDEAGVLEVISYNETAGRFEFQVVKNYRAGREPQVFYANRTVCTACHHNAAPIFSRPSWDETNANPAVARALAARAPSFHGVAVARGVDVPNAIDDAVARANRFAIAQAVWRDGCARVRQGSDPVDCRRAALAVALRSRLSAGGEVDLGSGRAQNALVRPLGAAWRDTWPAGLVEPDPSIPNRDPFFGDAQRIERSDEAPWGRDEITPGTDPLALRAPLAIWHGDADGIEQFARALASMLAVSDIAALDRRLAQAPAEGPAERIALDCLPAALARPAVELRCSGSTEAGAAATLEAALRLEGTRLYATIARLQVGKLAARRVVLAPAPIVRKGAASEARLTVAARGASARLADGRSLAALEVAWTPAADAMAYRVHLELDEAFAALDRALDAIADATRAGRSDALSDLPFRRTALVRALFAHLRIDPLPADCCGAAGALPAARLEHGASRRTEDLPAALRPFHQHCGACHAAPDASPPGFLHGDAAQVEASLARCAPRIAYRLDMWRTAPARRAKVPMPPPSFAASWEHAPPAGDLALMRSTIARLLAAAGPASPDRAYERLPACRAEGTNGRPRARAVTPMQGAAR